jgi:hypothetical protein
LDIIKKYSLYSFDENPKDSTGNQTQLAQNN